MTPPTIDPTLTLNEIAHRFPVTLGVLRDYGLDACCGGGLPLEQAAVRHRIDVAELRAALEGAVSGFDAAVNKGAIA